MSENPGPTHDVYLSYAPQDKTRADAACAMLERQRIRCWVASRDIAPGDERNAAIMKAINQSQIMVVIFSTHANASGQVHREVERACNRGMTVLPIRIEDVEPEGAMKFSLHNKHWLDACTPPFKRHLEKIAQTVKVILGQDVEPMSSAEVEDEPTRSSDRLRVAVGPRWPRALWAAMAAGVLMLGLLGAWMGGLFGRTPEGTIILENLPSGSEALVDGKTVAATPADGGEPLPITTEPGDHTLGAPAGKHRLVVRRGDVVLKRQDVTIDSSGQAPIRIRLEGSVTTEKAGISTPGPLGGKGGLTASEVGGLRTPVSEIRDVHQPSVASAADYLQIGSVWLAEPGGWTFTILERQGERFKSLFVVGKQIREVSGTIKNGRLRWLAKDVKVRAGNPGNDNEGEIKGTSVEMTHSKPSGPVLGRFTLRLKTAAPAGAQIAATPLASAGRPWRGEGDRCRAYRRSSWSKGLPRSQTMIGLGIGSRKLSTDQLPLPRRGFNSFRYSTEETCRVGRWSETPNTIGKCFRAAFSRGRGIFLVVEVHRISRQNATTLRISIFGSKPRWRRGRRRTARLDSESPNTTEIRTSTSHTSRERNRGVRHGVLDIRRDDLG